MAFEKFIKLFQGGQKQHDPTTDGLQLKKLELGSGTPTEVPLKFTSSPVTTDSQIGAAEFSNDDYYLGITTPVTAPGPPYVTQVPPAYNDTYVKATSELHNQVSPHFATDITKPLIDEVTYRAWISGSETDQRFHIDLGSAKVINRVYYENLHIFGGSVDAGVKNFTLWGSNDWTDFAATTYGVDGTWVQLVTDVTEFDKHVAANQADPKYIIVTNTTAYRYYGFKFSNNWGMASGFMGVRRIELQYGESSNYRKGIILNNGANLIPTKIPKATTNGRLVDSQISDDGTTVLIGTENPLRPITEKIVIVDADEVQGNDSVNTFSPIRTTWANVKAFLATYFSGLYLVLLGKSGGQTANGGTGASENLTLSSTTHATKGKIIAQDEFEATTQASVVETLISTCSTYTKTSGQQEAVLRTESEFITDTTILTSILLETNWVAGVYSPATVPVGFVEGSWYRGDKFWYLYQNSVLTRTRIDTSIPDFTNSYLFES